MKKNTLLLSILLLLLLGNRSFSQTNCDSLQIDCCNFELLGNDTISLVATNTSTQEIFDYPGFLLLDQNDDTLAQETVNYFGIGLGAQTHYLSVQNSITFSMEGTLELWGLFYDTLYCSYPITINSIGIDENLMNDLNVYPNPVLSTVKLSEIESGLYSIYSTDGKIITAEQVFNNFLIDLSKLSHGAYILEIKSTTEKFRSKIIKE